MQAGDVEQLLTLIERARTRDAQRSGQVAQTRFLCEAGYDGFCLHRRARRVGTDRIDADTLLRALMAHTRGDWEVWRLVQGRTPEHEGAKRPHRERRRLVRERAAHVHRIRGFLASPGIFDLHPLRADRRERLDALVTGDGRPLGKAIRQDIVRQFDRLELVLSQLNAIEAERDTVAGKDANTRKLTQLRGIGPEIATVLAREVFHRGFSNRRQVASHAGLTPSPFAGDERSRDQGIGKAGNAPVRTTMVEAAWLWLRYQPDSQLARWFVAHPSGAAGRIRQIAIVALTRKLLPWSPPLAGGIVVRYPRRPTEYEVARAYPR